LVKVLVAFIGSILIFSTLVLSQGVFAQSDDDSSDSASPSVPDLYDLASPIVVNLDELSASTSGSFEPVPAGTDIDTNLGGFEPHAVVNPFNSANVAVAQGANILLSTDFGATFPITVNAQIPPTLGAGYFFCGDPSLTFDSQGRLFWSYLTCSFDFGNLLDLSVAVLQVNPTTGATIGNAVDLTPGIFIDDKNWIAADANPASPFADNLYMVWARFDTQRVLFSMSTNQGVTWTAPQAISTAAEWFAWPPHITVGPNGDVYANYPTDTCQQVGTVQVLRDTTGGSDLSLGNAVQKTAAFTAQQSKVTCNVQHFPFSLTAIPQTNFWLQGSAAAYTIADPLTAGRIYVVGNDDPNNIFGNGDDGDVVMATSTDFGNTWAVSTVTTGPANSLQVMPTAAIDQLGNIMVSWYDTRAGNTNAASNFLLDLYATISTDGGVSFTNDFQINDVAFDPDLNAPARFNGPPPTLRIGEYNGLAAANCLGYAAWTGNDAISNFQEIFFDTFSCTTVIDSDFGDAPDPTYPTLLASDGARHIITGPFLGASVDADADGQPTPNADGDDSDGTDDEDGIMFTSSLVQGLSASLDVTASAPAVLNAWVDFNDDGDFADDGEQVFTDLPLAAGINSLMFNVPSNAIADTTFSRFRIDGTGGLSFNGFALTGEVEDYQVTIEADTDMDGIPDSADNCPDDANPGQEDLDGDGPGDGTGDACDLSNLITTDTTLATDHSVISDVIVQVGVTLTVPNPHSLTLNSANLIVTGTLVVDGGSILVS